MKTTLILVGLFAVLFAVIAVTVDRGCNGRTTEKQVTVTVRDTVRLAAIRDTLTVTRRNIVTIDGDTIRDTVRVAQDVQRLIDSALVFEHLRELTACADSVVRHNEYADTVRVCYALRSQKFFMAVQFAPRVHDTTVIVPELRHALRGGAFAVANIDLSQQVFAGAGYGVTLFDKLELSGAVGLQREPFEATARVETKWNF